MTFDAQSAAILLFGGQGPGGTFADTWAWNGQNWTQVADTGPSARLGHAMATADQAVLLFGGLTAPNDGGAGSTPLNDTWAWQDGVWRQIQDMGPAPRSGHAMACVTDAAGDHVTLFGGEGAAALGDTWLLVERF